MGNIYQPPTEAEQITDPNLVGVWKYRTWTKGYKVLVWVVVINAVLAIPFSYGLALLYVPFILFIGSIVHRSRKKSVVLVYKDRLEINNSFVRTNQIRFEASKIEAVTVNQSLLGKSAYGSVFVTGSGGTKRLISPIIDQESLGEAIRAISSAPASKVAAVITPTPGADEPQQGNTQTVAEELKQVKELHDMGILTDAEYEKKRSELVKKI